MRGTRFLEFLECLSNSENQVEYQLNHLPKIYKYQR